MFDKVLSGNKIKNKNVAKISHSVHRCMSAILPCSFSPAAAEKCDLRDQRGLTAGHQNFSGNQFLEGKASFTSRTHPPLLPLLLHSVIQSCFPCAAASRKSAPCHLPRWLFQIRVLYFWPLPPLHTHADAKGSLPVSQHQDVGAPFPATPGPRTFTWSLLFEIGHSPLETKLSWLTGGSSLLTLTFQLAPLNNPSTQDKFFDTSDNSISVDYRGDPQIGAELIKYSNDDTIYKTERHAYNSFKYTLPVDKMKGQNYVIILKFCESYFRSKGKRMFNIKLGSKIVRKDMDIFEKAGGRLVAYDEYIEFKYVDGQVQIKGTPINDAIVDGKLVLTFEKTNFDNPIINGIVLYEGMIVGT